MLRPGHTGMGTLGFSSSHSEIMSGTWSTEATWPRMPRERIRPNTDRFSFILLRQIGVWVMQTLLRDRAPVEAKIIKVREWSQKSSYFKLKLAKWQTFGRNKLRLFIQIRLLLILPWKPVVHDLYHCLPGKTTFNVTEVFCFCSGSWLLTVCCIARRFKFQISLNIFLFPTRDLSIRHSLVLCLRNALRLSPNLAHMDSWMKLLDFGG